jgi:hypothetical protein
LGEEHNKWKKGQKEMEEEEEKEAKSCHRKVAD